MDLIGDLVALVEGGVGLGVGIGAGLEVAVGLFLDGNDVGLDAHPAEELPDGLVAGAAEGGVDHVEAGALDPLQIQTLLHDPVDIGRPEGRGDVIDHAFGLQRVEALLGQNEVGRFLDLVIDDGGGLVGHLAAVLAVALDAVVDAGVVGGGDHDAAAAFQLADGVGEHGRGGQFVVDVDLDPGLGQGRGADLRVGPGIVAAVVADGAALGQLGAVQPLGDALGRPADGKLVEAVTAEAHDAADAGGTEGQLGAEAALQSQVVALHALEHVSVGNGRVFKPKFVLFQIIHSVLPDLLFRFFA